MKRPTKIIGGFLISIVIGAVIWFIWSAQSEQAARNLQEDRLKIASDLAQQNKQIMDLDVQFGYEVFGHGSKGKTYEMCLRYPPETKENKRKCELLSAEIKRREKAIKPW